MQLTIVMASCRQARRPFFPCRDGRLAGAAGLPSGAARHWFSVSLIVHGGGAQSDRRGEPAAARGRAQPLLGFEALAVPSRAHPRVRRAPGVSQPQEIIGFVALYVVVRRGPYLTCRRVLLALTDRRIAIGAAVVLGVALDVTAFAPAEHRLLATGFGAEPCPPRRGTRTKLADAGRRRGGVPAALADARGQPLQQSCRTEAAGCLSRLYRILPVRQCSTRQRYRDGLKGALTQFEAALRGSGYRGRLEPAGFADFWRRIMACSCDARQRDPSR